MDIVNGKFVWSRTDFENAYDIMWDSNKHGYSCHGKCVKQWKRWYHSEPRLKLVQFNGEIEIIKESEITGVRWER